MGSVAGKAGYMVEVVQFRGYENFVVVLKDEENDIPVVDWMFCCVKPEFVKRPWLPKVRDWDQLAPDLGCVIRRDREAETE